MTAPPALVTLGRVPPLQRALHLAQVNIATLRQPIDHPDTADFAGALDQVNGEGEAAPGGAQEGEPCGAVGGVEEGAGEGEEVEDLLALAEGFDLDGAEGDGGGLLEGGYDLNEVAAVADQDS